MSRSLLKAAALILVLCPFTASRAQAKEPYRGTTVTYRNAVSMRTLQKDAELTYNPYYAMELQLQPQWWFGDIFYLQASFGIATELTNADETTKRQETWPSDVVLRAGAGSFYTIPVVGLAFSANFDLIAPSSPTSQARSTLIGLQAGLGVRRTFKVLSGISLGYSFQARKSFYKYTTAQRDAPLIGSCVGGGCAEYYNTGVRNASWRLVNSFDVSFGFTDWLSLSASVQLVNDFLFDKVDTPGVSYVALEDQDNRYLLSYELEVSFQPVKGFFIGVGASTTNPELAPNSKPETAFFNRYTVFYFDLRLELAGLVSNFKKSSN